MSNSRDHDDLLEDLLESIIGPSYSGARGQIRANLQERGNTPTGWEQNLARYRHRPHRPPRSVWVGE
jgi:hypothetical protein